MSDVLTFTDLQTLTGYTRPADVLRCLRDQHVPVFIGKDGPWTTLDALNQALGVKDGSSAEAIRF